MFQTVIFDLDGTLLDTMPDLMDADEIIVTSSSNLCLHANQIDGQPAGMKDEKNYEALRSSVLEEFLEQTEC
jgi:D-alanine transaminase